MNLTVHVQYPAGRAGLPRPQSVRTWVRAALRGRRRLASLTVRFVDRREGLALNRQWRSKQAPTNVLSFPTQGLEKLAPAELGDIVVCGPVVAREAAEQRKPLRAHFAHLVIHGTLHLLGYDHQHQKEADEMEAAETAILAKLGYPDPYTLTL
jgi:probable rRNA maturation factor